MKFYKNDNYNLIAEKISIALYFPNLYLGSYTSKWLKYKCSIMFVKDFDEYADLELKRLIRKLKNEQVKI